MSNSSDVANGTEPVPILAEEGVSSALKTLGFQPTVFENSMTSVVRIKRKLLEDPAEALLLTCKRKKLEEGSSKMAADLIQINENVFHFATTLKCKSSLDKQDKMKVREAISMHQKLKDKQQICKREKLKNTSNEDHCFASLKNRLKLGKKRHTELPNEKNPTSNEADLTSVSLPGANTQVMPAKMLKKSDEEINVGKNPSASLHNTIENPASGDDILCNSVKMFREKLNISSPSKEEFVFDFYYCSKELDWSHHDILDVKPCRYEDFVWDSSDNDDKHQFDDDDDSNDEDNWRNDYPDDEDSIDDDERRFIYDEEEDFNDSDDGRDRENGHGFYDGGMCDIESLSSHYNTHADTYDDFPILYENDDHDF